MGSKDTKKKDRRIQKGRWQGPEEHFASFRVLLRLALFLGHPRTRHWSNYIYTEFHKIQYSDKFPAYWLLCMHPVTHISGIILQGGGDGATWLAY